jgi:hypothetical protein
MIARILDRRHRAEDGYALVIAVILLFVMTILLVVGLDAGISALNQSQRGIHWSRTLTVAESGVNDAIARLGVDRAATSDCPTTGTTTCPGNGGEYQVDWTSVADGSMTIDSVGYFPTRAAAKITRHVRVTLEPAPAFTYALFAEDTLAIKNNPIVVGDIYSTLGVQVDNNIEICGSIVVANGNVTMGNGSSIVKSDASIGCTGKSADVSVGGSIQMSNGAHIDGDATASAPTGTTCSAASPSYAISGGTVAGDATACGKITSIVGGASSPGTSSTQPAVQSLPEYSFDVANYPGIHCYPSSGTCGPTNTSATAVSLGNSGIAANKTNLQGTYAIWQTSPSQSTKVDLDGVVLGGDTTIVTNAPIDFGNTSTVNLAPGVSDALFVVISLYQPTGSCDDNGGDCSIYGKNSIAFTRGVLSDPDDGIAGLLYTPGKMAFKNKGTPGEGSLYAGAIDVKNGFGMVYNPRIERILGFGASLEPTLWEELDAS